MCPQPFRSLPSGNSVPREISLNGRQRPKLRYRMYRNESPSIKLEQDEPEVVKDDRLNHPTHPSLHFIVSLLYLVYIPCTGPASHGDEDIISIPPYCSS